MLLEYLMKSHEVDVDILLECEEGPGDGVGHAARALDFMGVWPMLPTVFSMPEISDRKSVTRWRVKLSTL